MMHDHSAIQIDAPPAGINLLATAINRIAGQRPTSHLVSALGLAIALAGMSAAEANTYTVVNTRDAGAGSLRKAVLDANARPGADTIVFAPSVKGTIALTSGALDVVDSLTVKGPGATTLSLNGKGSDIFTLHDGPQAGNTRFAVSGLMLTGGRNAIAEDDSFYSENVSEIEVVNSDITGNSGDGIAVRASPQVSIFSSSITDNSGRGVTFHSWAGSDVSALTIKNSIVSGNESGIRAAGDWYYYDVNVTIEDSSISGNRIGDGVYVEDGHASVLNSRIQDNAGKGVHVHEVRNGARRNLIVRNSTVSGNGWVGVEAYSTMYLILDSSTVSGNGYGGVDAEEWTGVSIVNSTISGNRNNLGVLAYSRSTIVENSTITNNQGGIWATEEAGLTLSNSIVTGNGTDLPPSYDGDSSPVTATYSLIGNPGTTPIVDPIPGSNLIGKNPRLGPLQDNGGPTKTHALLTGSPAIDRGDPSFVPPPDSDQRGEGFVRMANGRIDMGAVERQTTAAPFGALQLSQNWVDLCSNGLAGNAVVLLGTPTVKEADPGVARLATPGAACAFQARFQEWDYRARNFGDLTHAKERVPYLGLPPGRYTMPDGSVWEVGEVSQKGTGAWSAFSFQSRFAGVPSLFLTLQSANGDSTVTARARNVTRAGFEAALFEEEALMGGHAAESIGYLAIHHPSGSSGVVGHADLQGVEATYRLDRSQLDHTWTSVGGVALKLEEEPSRDPETKHPRETVDVLQLGSLVFAQQVSSNNVDTTAIRRR